MIISDIDYKVDFDTDYPYFLYAPESDGFYYFKTEKDRDDFAKLEIAEYLDDGWMEEVEGIMAGKITHTTQQTNRTEKPDNLDEDGLDGEGLYWAPEWDYVCNYELIPIGKS